ncbi:DNA-processing protein DprA [Litoribrevibacter euphylliae]|uniref:DNA-processing protein DprA n=1 Tax=Litoribrevibacter euphylliae TaxID=1834034 RepID=A0ABV7HMW2_9GAMM
MHDPSLFFSSRTLHWLKLSLIPGISCRTLMKLQTVYPQPEDILILLASGEWRNLPLQKSAKHWLAEHSQDIDAALKPKLEQTLEWVQQGGFVLDWQSPDYPPLLKEIYDAPVIIYGLGQRQSLMASCSMAMVGSRKATRYGVEQAHSFAYQLVHQGWQVVSGMALGIDGAGHQGALQAVSEGAAVSTVAVVATGLDLTYPSSHKQLKQRIMETGCVISEYPLGTQAKANYFPRRNRIISGLSQGVLVIEATEKSGSLVSARCALEQNRDVFALPGLITNPQAEGCHSLIKQGAKLVTSVEDILEEYATGHQAQLKRKTEHRREVDVSVQPIISRSQTLVPSELVVDSAPLSLVEPTVQPESQHSVPDDPILSAIGSQGASADEIIVRTGMSWAELSQKLLMLELTGVIESKQGGYALKSH